MAEEENRNIDLCIEVEKYPCLYDVSLDDHSNRQALEKAWAKVGAKLSLSGEVCKKRWVNLRTVFVRRRAKSVKSGSGFKKEYYLNKYMQFLIPHIKLPVQSTGSNLGGIHDEHSKDFYIGSTSDKEQSSSQATIDDEDILLERDSHNHNFSGNISQESLGDNVNYETIIKSRRQKKLTSASKVDEAFIDYFQAKKQKMSVESENARKCFLLSLLPEVDALPEAQFKIFKWRSLALLDELEVPRPTTSTSYETQDQWDIHSGISSPSNNIALLNMPSESNPPTMVNLFIPPEKETQPIEKNVTITYQQL